MKILLVDDDIAGLISLKELIEIDHTFKVDTASTFDEAIHLIENNLYECIITDIFLDKNTGYDILKHVRKKNPIVPVIGITGYNEIVEFSEHFDAVFLKPYLFRELLDKVFELIKKRYFVKVISDEKELDELDTFFNRSFNYNICCTEEYVDIVRDYLNDKLDFYRGAVVPAIISGFQVIEKGVMIVRHSEETEISILNLNHPEEFEDFDKRTLMLFYDHNCNINELEVIIKKSKNRYCYGVGCGYKDEKSKAPAIFDKNGFYENSALVLQFDKKLNNFHYQEFDPAYGPLKLNWKNNLLKEINGESAFDFYLGKAKSIKHGCFLENSSCGIHHPIGLLDGDTGHFTLRIPQRYENNDKYLQIRGGFSDVSGIGYIFQHKKNFTLFEDILTRFKAEINVGNILFNYPYDAYREFGADHFKKFMDILKKHLPEEAVMGFLSHGIISSYLSNCKHPVSQLGVLIGNIE